MKIRDEVVLEDCMVLNVEEERSNTFVIKMNVQIINEEITILEKMCNVLSKETRERGELRSIDHWRPLGN